MYAAYLDLLSKHGWIPLTVLLSPLMVLLIRDEEVLRTVIATTMCAANRYGSIISLVGHRVSGNATGSFIARYFIASGSIPSPVGQGACSSCSSPVGQTFFARDTLSFAGGVHDIARFLHHMHVPHSFGSAWVGHPHMLGTNSRTRWMSQQLYHQNRTKPSPHIFSSQRYVSRIEKYSSVNTPSYHRITIVTIGSMVNPASPAPPRKYI